MSIWSFEHNLDTENTAALDTIWTQNLEQTGALWGVQTVKN